MLGGGRRSTDSVQLSSRLDRVFDVNCNLSPARRGTPLGARRSLARRHFIFT